MYCTILFHWAGNAPLASSSPDRKQGQFSSSRVTDRRATKNEPSPPSMGAATNALHACIDTEYHTKLLR